MPANQKWKHKDSNPLIVVWIVHQNTCWPNAKGKTEDYTLKNSPEAISIFNDAKAQNNKNVITEEICQSGSNYNKYLKQVTTRQKEFLKCKTSALKIIWKYRWQKSPSNTWIFGTGTLNSLCNLIRIYVLEIPLLGSIEISVRSNRPIGDGIFKIQHSTAWHSLM